MLDLAEFLDESLGVHSNYTAQLEVLIEQRQAKRKWNNEGRSLQRKTEALLVVSPSKPMSKRRRPVVHLSEKQVFAIRELSKQGSSNASLSSQFKVDMKCIHNILQRKTWGHV